MTQWWTNKSEEKHYVVVITSEEFETQKLREKRKAAEDLKDL